MSKENKKDWRNDLAIYPSGIETTFHIFKKNSAVRWLSLDTRQQAHEELQIIGSSLAAEAGFPDDSLAAIWGRLSPKEVETVGFPRSSQ